MHTHVADPTESPRKPLMRMRFFGVWLCAVAVVAAVMLFPVFATQRIIDRAASDQSNFKQLGFSVIMYTSDNDDRYMLATNWMDTIQPYLRNEPILHSLALQRPGSAEVPIQSTPYGIAFRKSLAGVDCNNLVVPEQIAVLFDSTELGRNASGELNLLPDPPRHKSKDGTPCNLVGFADGHVKSVPKPVVIVR